MNSPEEQDPTWKLLLKSKNQQPSPSFVRNVVREVRKLETDRSAESPAKGLMTLLAWFKRPAIALPVAIGATAALVSALIVLQPSHPSSSAANSASLAKAAIADVPNLIPAMETSIVSHASSAEVTISADSESGITEDLERINGIAALVAVADPADLDDAALANLFF